MTPEQNDRLTRVGRGTPMGELLRRYWHPVAAVSEFDEKPPVQAIRPFKLMGEDLVLYRDLAGRYGVVDRHCAHRRADMAFGYVEAEGIRCNYHGWMYNQAGSCVHQPFEDTTIDPNKARDTIRITAYQARAHAGMIWVYMGPAPAPDIPNFEPFTYENCFKQIMFANIPCNWLQNQENGMDPVHFEWLHANWSQAQNGSLAKSPKHVKLGFDEWEFGFRYKRVLENTTEQDRLWTDGRVTILPNIFVPDHFEWRVPVDDTNTLAVLWHFTRVPNDRVPYSQDRIPYWWAPSTDEKGALLVDRIVHQDAAACIGQGPIMDRSKERLGTSDRGVIMLRRQLERDMEAVERGEDPKGILRNVGPDHIVRWPNNVGEEIARGKSREEWLTLQKRFLDLFGDEYMFLYDGQPAAVRAEYKSAMGIS